MHVLFLSHLVLQIPRSQKEIKVHFRIAAPDHVQSYPDNNIHFLQLVGIVWAQSEIH